MNNLKRILSLALASVMVLGMMVVGASAKEFTDGDTIANTDAVDTLVALNIIGGFDDGSFQPEGDVTRAQMAKMIAVALHGGDEDFRGSSTGSQFKDVPDGKWYVKFVNYCASENIINGRSATEFDPEANVTATEAAVMIMRAMGYRNETFLNEAGNYSPAAVDKLAEKLGLYNDTTKLTDTSAALNRQNAAQVICNALQLKTPVYTMTYNSQGVRTWSLESTDGKSILQDKYEATIEYGILDSASYSASAKAYIYNINSEDQEADAFGTGDTNPLVCDIDVSDLFMQCVKIVYTGTVAPDGSATVLSITPAFNNVLKSGVGLGNELTAGRIDGLLKDADFDKVNFLNATGTAQAWWAYDLIDNTGNGKVNAMVSYPVTVAKVASVSKTQVTFVSGATAVKLEGNNVATGIAKNDWVIISTDVTGTTTVEKMDVIENVTATNMDKSSNYTIGGKKYKLQGTSVDLGETYNISVLNGYVFGAVTPEGTTAAAAGLDKLVLVIAAGDFAAAKDAVGKDLQNGTGTQQVQLMYANGTANAVKTVTNIYTGAEGETALNTQVKSDNLATIGEFYTYAEASNGTYSLTEVDLTADWNSMKEIDAVSAIKDGKNGSVRFNPDALIFVEGTYETTKKQYKLFTGAQVNEWDTTGITGALQTTTQNGFPYAVLGALKITLTEKDAWPGAAKGDDQYGFLVATGDRAYVDALEGDYTRLTIWTGTAEVTRYIEETKESFNTNSAANKYAAGTIVKYAEAADNTIELKPVTAVPAAVSAYAGGDTIQFKGKSPLTGDFSLKNATIIYINDEDNEGAEAATIQMATEANVGDELVRNVYVVAGTPANGVTPVLALFVDVNGEIDNQVYAPVTVTKTPVAGAEPTDAEKTAAANTLKALDDGAYKGAAEDKALAAVLESINGLAETDMTKIVIIKVGVEAGKSYVLSIKKGTTEVKTETLTMAPDATGTTGIFYYSTTEQSWSGDYTYTVKVGTTTVLSGSFQA